MNLSSIRRSAAVVLLVGVLTLTGAPAANAAFSFGSPAEAPQGGLQIDYGFVDWMVDFLFGDWLRAQSGAELEVDG